MKKTRKNTLSAFGTVKNCMLSLLLLSLLTACLPDEKNNAKAVRVVIADRVFEIPKGYFDGRQPTGKDTESAVLEYELPGFKVLPKNAVQRQKLLDEGRMRGMLLENASKRPPIEVMVSNNFNRLIRYSLDSKMFGLEKYTAPKLNSANAIKPEDIFLEKDEQGTVQSFLMCSAPGTVKIPSCRHTFTDQGVLFRIHWNISNLANWKTEQETAINFIADLEETSNIKEK